MRVSEAVRKRYSVRAYQPRQVEEDKLQALLEGARMAPSASNRQEWRFVVVRDLHTRTRLSEAACDQPFVAQAPVVLVCCAESDGHIMACGHACYPIDVATAIDHITLLATEIGLGTCWIGAFDADAVRAILHIPSHIHVVELLLIGYPADAPCVKSRLPLAKLVHYDRW